MWRTGFSLLWLLLLWSTGFRGRTQELWCTDLVALGQLSGIFYMEDSIWNLPKPGMKAMSAALAGRFLTSRPPKKPSMTNFYIRKTN